MKKAVQLLDYIRLRNNHLGIIVGLGTLHRAPKTALVNRRLIAVAPIIITATGEEHVWIPVPHIAWALQKKRQSKQLALHGFIPMHDATRGGIYLFEEHWSPLVRETLQSALSAVERAPIDNSTTYALIRLDGSQPFQVVRISTATETPLPCHPR